MKKSSTLKKISIRNKAGNQIEKIAKMCCKLPKLGNSTLSLMKINLPLPLKIVYWNKNPMKLKVSSLSLLKGGITLKDDRRISNLEKLFLYRLK